jgi:hypothetical protein
LPPASTPRPQPPFADWPIQVFDARMGFGWWARPAVFVSQAIIERGDVPAVDAVQGWIDACLRERADEVRAAGGLFVFHDWRTLRGYSSEARALYLARMRARPKDYLRHSVTCVPVHPLVRMAVEAGNLVAALTARAKVEIAADPARVLAEHGILPPIVGSPFPGTR